MPAGAPANSRSSQRAPSPNGAPPRGSPRSGIARSSFCGGTHPSEWAERSEARRTCGRTAWALLRSAHPTRSAIGAVRLAGADEGGDDAVQGAQFLLGAPRALEQVAQVARHARALIGVAQK